MRTLESPRPRGLAAGLFRGAEAVEQPFGLNGGGVLDGVGNDQTRGTAGFGDIHRNVAGGVVNELRIRF